MKTSPLACYADSMSEITIKLLTQLGVHPTRARKYQPYLNTLLPEHGIDTPLRQAHFLGQVLRESGNLRAVVENLNYSAPRLLQVFGSRRFNQEQATRYAHHPEMIGSRVYAGRLGNGPESTGDGFKYCGRGLIQITGKAHYAAFSVFAGVDALSRPEIVERPRFAVLSAVYFWCRRGLNEYADKGDIVGITKRVNGRAMRGLAERREIANKALELLTI